MVLKGDDTLVADPAGAWRSARAARPALATAGTGDVLSGVIAALLAHGLDPFAAACAGVRLHRAGGPRGRSSAPTASSRATSSRPPTCDRRAPRALTRADARSDARPGRVAVGAWYVAGAIERGVLGARVNWLRAAPGRRPPTAPAVRGGQGRRLRARRGGRAPAPRWPAARRWLAVAAAEEATALRAAGIEAPPARHGRADARRARAALGGRRRRRRLARGLRRRASRPRAAGASTSSSTPAWGASARATRPRPPASPSGRGGADGVELAGLMTHFATADEPGDAFFGEQLERFRAVGASRCSAAHPGPSCTRPTARPRCATPASHFDMVRCGIAIYGLDPFQQDAAAQRLEPALELRPTSPRSSRCAAGQSAGLRAPLRRRARHRPGHAPDRLRRRRPPRADQQLRRADRRPPLPAGGHRLDGQRHRRPRRRRRRGRGAAQPAVLIGARREDDRRGRGRAPGHDQLRDHLRRSPPACRARTTATERPA